VSTDGQTHTHARTDAKRFYYLSHAICYSYGADNKFSTQYNITNHEFAVRLAGQTGDNFCTYVCPLKSFFFTESFS